MATAQKQKRDATMMLAKSIIVPVPQEVGNWEASDHSANIAQIVASVDADGHSIVGMPVYKGHEVNPDAPYTSTLLHYEVEVLA